MPDTNNPTGTGATAFNLQLPEFLEHESEIFFIILEAQLWLRSTTSEVTKFYAALSSLPAAVLSRIPRAILKEPKYDELKQAIISVCQKKKKEHYEKLIQDTKITGIPSVYLEELLNLADRGNIEEGLVRRRFIEALPPSVGRVVAMMKNSPLIELGTFATELMCLAKEVEYLPCMTTPTQAGAELIPISVRPFYPNQRTCICRAHIYFGRDARTCKHWCQWLDKKNCQIRPNSRARITHNEEGPEN